MAITVTESSKEIVSRLIRDKFDSLNQYWQYASRMELIQTAQDFGLNKLVTELKDDL